MNISVFGPGYVGLVTAAGFAEMGNRVWGVGRRQEQADALNRGETSIYEPGLSEMIERNRLEGRLEFTTDAETAIKDSTYIFICVGTPPNEDGSSDLSAVIAVAETIGEIMNGYKVVINKSTVPVGTAELVRNAVAGKLKERGESHEYDVVSNPEFLKEGAAISDFMKPDRVVVGADSKRAVKHMESLYKSFSRLHDKVLVMDVRSAEMTKYAANCMLAAKISFMNEIANICERVGADVACVRQGIGSDPRIGFHFIYPGAGYGGSCFPKDVKALVSTARTNGYRPELLESVDKVNARQKLVMPRKVVDHFNGDVSGRTLALWGLAFKPNTDDVREASAFALIDELTAKGMRIRAYDPKAGRNAREHYAGNPLVDVQDEQYSVLEGADALAVLTEWNQFRNPDFGRILATIREKVIFDGRNLYEPATMKALGVRYYGIGREAGPGMPLCGCTFDRF